MSGFNVNNAGGANPNPTPVGVKAQKPASELVTVPMAKDGTNFSQVTDAALRAELQARAATKPAPPSTAAGMLWGGLALVAGVCALAGLVLTIPAWATGVSVASGMLFGASAGAVVAKLALCVPLAASACVALWGAYKLLKSAGTGLVKGLRGQ